MHRAELPFFWWEEDWPSICGTPEKLKPQSSMRQEHRARTQHAGATYHISLHTHARTLTGLPSPRCIVSAVIWQVQDTIGLADWPPCQAAIAQLGERQTEDLKVPSSIVGLGRE